MSIEIRNLEMRYGEARALEGVSASVGDAVRVLALVGPSGGGKSTLLRLLGGLERPTAGEIRIDGAVVPTGEEALRRFRLRNGFLFQAFNLFPHLTALENVALPLVIAHGRERVAAAERARSVIERFGLAPHADKRPAQLSGGQQQRIALARALAHEPEWLLLDEPTSALDPEMTAEVLDLVAEVVEAGQRTVLATHEMGFARHSADHVVFLAEGRAVESAPAASLFESPETDAVRGFLEKVMRW